MVPLFTRASSNLIEMELQQRPPQTGRMQNIDYTLAKGHLPTNQQKHCRRTDEQKDEDGDGHHEGGVSIESDGRYDARFENAVPPKKTTTRRIKHKSVGNFKKFTFIHFYIIETLESLFFSLFIFLLFVWSNLNEFFVILWSHYLIFKCSVGHYWFCRTGTELLG